MGPPPQPMPHDGEEVVKADKATDVTQLQDVINAAGVDVAAEENYLADTYRNIRNFGYQNESFATTSSSTISPNTSFTQLSQGISGHPALRGSGLASQPAQSQDDIDRELKRQHQSAARAYSETAHEPLRSPFLLMNVVRHKLSDRAYENGVHFDVNGVYDPIDASHNSKTPYRANSTVMGGQNGPGLISTKPHALLQHNAALVDMLSLVSLAAQERIRGLVEDAYGYSRGRRASADGVAPPEWSDLAVGNGEVSATAASESITNTPWDQPPDSAVSPTSNPLKRRLSQQNYRSIYADNFRKGKRSDPLPSKAFKSPLPAHLRALAAADREAEKARLKARKTRQGQTAADPSAPNGATAQTPGASPAPGTVAPELQGAIKMTKKEREKLKKADLNEEVMHKNANQAATNAFGKTFSRYSWMTGGGGSAAGSGTSTPRGGAPATNGPLGGGGGAGAVKGGAAGGVNTGVVGKEKRWGEWREDGEKGAGIQVRDWIEALEKDGKERKALILALAKLNSRETNGAERYA